MAMNGRFVRVSFQKWPKFSNPLEFLHAWYSPQDPCDAFDKPPAGHFCAMLRAGGGRLRNWCADDARCGSVGVDPSEASERQLYMHFGYKFQLVLFVVGIQATAWMKWTTKNKQLRNLSVKQ